MLCHLGNTLALDEFEVCFLQPPEDYENSLATSLFSPNPTSQKSSNTVRNQSDYNDVTSYPYLKVYEGVGTLNPPHIYLKEMEKQRSKINNANKLYTENAIEKLEIQTFNTSTIYVRKIEIGKISHPNEQYTKEPEMKSSNPSNTQMTERKIWENF